MPDGIDPLDVLFEAADDDAWRQLMADERRKARLGSDLDDETYAAAFGTPAGRLVLRDMLKRYVMVTRADPHDAPEAAFYREGMAQVVFEIVDKCNRAEERDDEQG